MVMEKARLSRDNGRAVCLSIGVVLCMFKINWQKRKLYLK